ncbi:multicopper oxidase domain-containing protein [Micromonospora polyrhachis]|uniref:Bilirubin oxidase n=1 Tax=Micromonospora polyrhachis TaxID=1282883 RepID=A0A7W7WSC1_9ACTN|nr:multicopper oxidase domain-containing protein [Micromonospora polyrhachis]MBB4961970.1 bilirubin oxidase [Micromonospora polyrhachis]
MIARRQLLMAGAAGGAALLLPPGSRRASAAGRRTAPTLDPTTIPKYVTNLVVPGVMPRLETSSRNPVDEYRIGVRQFRQQVLPPGYPTTAVWGYGSSAHPRSFGFPACTIEARVDRPVRVTWVNELVDANGRFLPHLLPVDPTLHWANPGGGVVGRDRHVRFTSTPEGYTGPVPVVSHVHGARVLEDGDGYPEAWYLPVARNIPRGYATVGSYYDEFHTRFADRHKVRWRPGSATFQYENEQHATALWYHDHALGLTRLNVYAGPVGLYLIRGGPSDLPAGVLPAPASDPVSRRHEIPMIIQDRTFHRSGALYYPDHPDIPGFAGPYIPDSDIPPIWTETFLGNTMLVNGRTWPKLDVEPRRYRLRILNACNARFLQLRITANPTARRVTTALPLWQMGGDGGFLPEPVEHEALPVGNGERVDVVVDFTGVPEGTELYLVNEGPDGHYRGGEPGRDFEPADQNTTGQVMKFVVGARIEADTTVPPDRLQLPTFTPLGPAKTTRRLSINVVRSEVRGAGPVGHLLGQVDSDGRRVLRRWGEQVTETPTVGVTEIWEFRNFTPYAHPIHIHHIQFQVIGRGPDGRQPPESWETGYKDVVMTFPGDRTRVKVRFDQVGRFVWHCHLLEHEDNEMMLPFIVGNPVQPLGAPGTGDGGAIVDTRPPLGVVGAGLLAASALGGIVLTRRQRADEPSV